MENQELPLHAQKVAILSRLIKESSLTLEEALLILKEEEKPVEIQTAPGTTSPWTVNPGGSWWSTQPYITTPGTLTINTAGTVGIGTTTDANSHLIINGSSGNSIN